MILLPNGICGYHWPSSGITNYHTSLGCSPFKALYESNPSYGFFYSLLQSDHVDVEQWLCEHQTHLTHLNAHLQNQTICWTKVLTLSQWVMQFTSNYNLIVKIGQVSTMPSPQTSFWWVLVLLTSWLPGQLSCHQLWTKMKLSRKKHDNIKSSSAKHDRC